MIPLYLTILTNESSKELGYCLYYLIQKDTIVYIGATKRLRTRLLSHKKTKKFDKVAYLMVNSENIKDQEENEIKRWNPVYNKSKTGYIDGLTGKPPLPTNEQKFRVVTFVSEMDIAQDGGVKRWLKSMNLAMDKRVKSKKKK